MNRGALSGFNTTHASRHVAQLAAVLKAEQLETATAVNGITVLAIEKAAESPWRDRASLGRARNTDLTVIHQSVSKLHAHLTLSDRDAVDLVDQSSTNGVFVNGKRLDANTAVRLRDGDAVAFGEVAAKYHSTSGFLHFIEGLL